MSLATKLKLLMKIDYRVIWSSGIITKDFIKSLGSKKNYRFFPEGYNSTAPLLFMEIN